MIKSVEYFTPKRYEYDHMGEPYRVYSENETLRLQILIQTFSHKFLISIHARSNYYYYEQELEREFENNSDYPSEFINPEAFKNIANYFMIFDNKGLPSHSTPSLISMKKTIEESIKFIKNRMKNQIKEFEIEYQRRKKSNYNDNDDNLIYDEDDYSGYFPEEDNDEYDYKKELDLEDEIYPLTTLKEKIRVFSKNVKRTN